MADASTLRLPLPARWPATATERPSLVLVDVAVADDADDATVAAGLTRLASAGLQAVWVDPRCDGSDGDVRPSFVLRICEDAGTRPMAAVAISSQRPLLAAADGAGARGVMVPGRGTPPFHVRALHVAPDLAEAVGTVLGWASTYAP